MEKVGVFHSHLEYIMAFRYILLAFGTLVAIWYIVVNCVKKNLATLRPILNFTPGGKL
jgi:hypothetical protein